MHKGQYLKNQHKDTDFGLGFYWSNEHRFQFFKNSKYSPYFKHG